MPHLNQVRLVALQFIKYRCTYVDVQQSGNNRTETTPESIAIASQSMDDATISLDVMTTHIPSLLPDNDEEFNLHLSNATTECSIGSTAVIGTQDDVLDGVSVIIVFCNKGPPHILLPVQISTPKLLQNKIYESWKLVYSMSMEYPFSLIQSHNMLDPIVLYSLRLRWSCRLQ